MIIIVIIISSSIIIIIIIKIPRAQIRVKMSTEIFALNFV